MGIADIKADFLHLSKETQWTPFSQTPEQMILTKWCEINDSIIPLFMHRTAWDAALTNSQPLLRTRPDGKKYLVLPYDLKLSELVPIIEAVNVDTFGDGEKVRAQTESINIFGKQLQNRAIYLANNVSVDCPGRKIAEATVIELYKYGTLLSGNRGDSPIQISDIGEMGLRDDDLKDCDTWFFGEFQSEIDDSYRQTKISQYFRVCAAVQDLEAKHSEEYNEHRFLKQDYYSARWTQHQRGKVRQELLRPLDDLYSTIYKRGMHKLATEMRVLELPGFSQVSELLKIVGVDLGKSKNLLAEKIGISKLRIELEEIRKSGDKKKIGDKERQIARKIQKNVSIFSLINYDRSGFFPSQIVRDQKLNCFAFVALGVALFDLAGLNSCTMSAGVTSREFGSWTHYWNILLTEDTQDTMQLYDMQVSHPKSIKAHDLRDVSISEAKETLHKINSMGKGKDGVISAQLRINHPIIRVLATKDINFLQSGSIESTFAGNEATLQYALLEELVRNYEDDKSDYSQKAIQRLLEMINHLPIRNRSYYELQSSYDEAGSIERLKSLRKAVELDPHSIPLRSELASQYKHHGRGDLADRELLRAQEMSTWSLQAWRRMRYLGMEISERIRYIGRSLKRQFVGSI